MKRKLPFLLLSTLLFTACNFETLFQPTWDDSVKDYFDEYTNTASVGEYTISPEPTLIDKDGNICIPWSTDYTITLSLRNPQHYEFVRNSNMTLELAGNTEDSTLSGSDTITIVQDADDTSFITINIPSDFLMAHPTGADISPLVTLYHPVSQANFGTYNKLKLSSNSAPPRPTGAVVVQTNESPSTWVVCFNLPESGYINNYHSDLESLVINDVSYPISINNGTISYDSSQSIVTTTAPANTVANTKTGLNFTSNGQSTYILTGDTADENNKVYSVQLFDRAGLSTEFTVSAQGYKLSAPSAYLTSDTSYSSALTSGVTNKNTINQEDDGSINITLHGLANTVEVTYTDSDGQSHTVESKSYDDSDASIIYEVYSDSACSQLIKSGTISGLTGNITIPTGDSYIKALIRKPLYVDSDSYVWHCRTICTKLYVSSSGSDTENTGSKAKPFKTIQKALSVFENGAIENDYSSDVSLQVILLSDLTASSDFDFASNNDSFVNLSSYLSNQTVYIKSDGDTIRTISAGQDPSDTTARLKRVITTNAGKVYLENINVTGGYYSSGSSIYGGAIAVKNGNLNYTNGSVYENYAPAGAAIYVTTNSATEEPTLKLTNVNIYDNAKYQYGYGTAICASGSNTSISCTTCTFRDNGFANATSGSEGGGAIYLNASCLTLSDTTITGNTVKPSKGGAIYNNNGAITLKDDVEITGNTSGSEQNQGCGIYNNGSITLAGKNITIKSNTNYDDEECNLYLASDNTITIAADISDSEIGVYRVFEDGEKPSTSSPVNFTSGYGTYNTSSPYTIFTSETDYAIGTNDGEVAFKVSGGSFYIPTNYSFTTSLATANEDGNYTFYPGYAKTFTLSLSPTFEYNNSSSTLYYNYSDQKLYTDSAFTTVAAADSTVSWTAALYNGSVKACDLTPTNVSGGVSLTIPSTIVYEDTYTLKVTYTYMGLSYNANYTVYCIKNATDAAGIITSMTESGSISLSGTLTSADITTLNTALTTLATSNSNVKVTLDLSATSGLTELSDNAFKGSQALQGIILPDSITSIGYFAFMSCTSLINVTLPASITSISQNCFYNCTSLTSINIPEGVTSLNANAFGSCSSLTSVTLPSTLTSINAYCFTGDTSLTSIVLPNTITGIGTEGFSGCTELSTIIYEGTKSDWDSIILGSDWNADVPTNQIICRDGTINLGATEVAGSYDEVLASLSSATGTINLIITDTSITSDQLSTLASSISSSSASVNLDLSYITMTEIPEETFNENTKLVSIILPAGLLSIQSSTFRCCTKLTSVTIPSTVTDIANNAFYRSPASISFEGNTYLVVENNAIYNSNKTQLIKYCKGSDSSVTSFTVPASVTSIAGYAFCDSEYIESIIFESDSTLISIGDSAFDACSALSNISIPTSVTSIGSDAFAYDFGITSLTLPEGLTTIYQRSFQSCGFETITIPSNVTLIESSAFYGCTELTSITIPSSVISIGSYTFSECDVLTSVTFENTSGWKVDGTEIDVTDPSTNATNLTSTYERSTWTHD
ncbi:MAG: leucine-rich repeat domain-containing protein [Treponema sp.]|nr:leucine-rich repeat domain-containing protein [Treponema sp.]